MENSCNAPFGNKAFLLCFVSSTVLDSEAAVDTFNQEMSGKVRFWHFLNNSVDHHMLSWLTWTPGLAAATALAALRAK